MRTTGKLIIFIFTLLALAASAHAESPREELKQMVEQFQKTPTDNALREKIIKLATSIKPAPAIPEEANRAFVKGNVFQKEAKDASGYDFAITAYRDALRSAPWWGDAYFNLAVALEAAGKYDEAIASIRLFMISVPGGSAEAREAQNRIYAIEAKNEMASRQAVVLAAAERERQRPSVEGKWTDGNAEFQITKSGEKLSLIMDSFFSRSLPAVATVIEVNQQRIRFNVRVGSPDINSVDLSLSASGDELTGTMHNKLGTYPMKFTRMP